MTSNKPYLVRAFYDWISDNELTPYIAVDIHCRGVRVPIEYANDGQIVLNISAGAVGHIALGEFAIEFSARFGGKLEHLTVPYGAIGAIYAKENGAGTALPIEDDYADEEITEAKPSLSEVSSDTNDDDPEPTPPKPKGGRPSLKVVK
ncbi:ClpXP protease specificity-enhancing factor [Thalassotalea agarivorans]